MASWQEARQAVEKTELDAEKLLRQKSLYIKQKGEDYAYTGMNMVKDPNFAYLPGLVKEYLYTCARLEAQKTRLEALKNDMSFINSPAKMALLRTKYKDEKYEEKLKKQGIKNLDTVDSDKMLSFLRSEHDTLKSELQGSRLDFLEREAKLEAWIQAGKPMPKTIASLRAELAEDFGEDMIKVPKKEDQKNKQNKEEEVEDWDKEIEEEEKASKPIALMYEETLKETAGKKEKGREALPGNTKSPSTKKEP